MGWLPAPWSLTVTKGGLAAREYLLEKNPFYSSVLFVELAIYCLGEIRAALCERGAEARLLQYWQCQGEQ